MNMPDVDLRFFEGKTVLVTGGAGFVASHLAERLITLGAKVIVADDLSTGKKENFAAIAAHPNFTFIRADLNHFDEVALLFGARKIDFVFHYAALAGVKAVIERPLEVFKDVDGLKYILAMARANGVKKVVFSSSSEAYGEPVSLPAREDGGLNVTATDPYGLTKLVGENMLYYYWKRYGLPTTSLRFFNVYGPRQESSAYGFVVGIFIKKALAGEQPIIFGDGAQTRDFVYVDDNIEIALRAMLSDAANGHAVNVGSGRQTTIMDLAERIYRIAGKEMRPTSAPPRELEVKYRCPDITKMKQLLNYEPQVNLDDGLRRTFEWYQKQNQ